MTDIELHTSLAPQQAANPAAVNEPAHNGLPSVTDPQKCLLLVKKISKQLAKRLPCHVEIDDLISAGNEGLTSALLNYDPNECSTFETFASYRIRGAILDHLRHSDPATRNLRKEGRRLNAARQSLSNHLGRSPEVNEVAEELGITLDRLYQLEHKLHCTNTLNGSACSKHENVDFPSSTPDTSLHACPFSLHLRMEQKDLLSEAIADLPERTQLLLALRYQEELGLKEIADALGLTVTRISQLHTDAIRRLQQHPKLTGDFKLD